MNKRPIMIGPESPSPGVIWAAIIGNVLEWFDFVAFGFFTTFIAKAYFPAQTEMRSVLLAVATFGVGFVMRPVGAVLLGHYADRAGRRAALVLIIFLMTLGAAIIALMPTYGRVGVYAPILVVAARLIQGFSVGGEIGSATAFLIESAPAGRRNLYSSFQMAGQFAATLIIVVLGALLTRYLSPGQLDSWGWRIPFILGLIIGPFGLYIRARAIDSREFIDARKASDGPMRDLWRQHLLDIAAAFGLTILGTVFTYVLIVYMPTYATHQLGVKLSDAYFAVAVGAVAGFVTSIAVGQIADMIGRGRLIFCSALLIAIIVFPLLHLVASFPSAKVLAVVQIVFSSLLATYTVSALATAAEIFPARVRSTGLSVGYGLGVTVFGGFAPYIVTKLIDITGDRFAAAFYVACAALLSLLALFLLRKRNKRVL